MLQNTWLAIPGFTKTFGKPPNVLILQGQLRKNRWICSKLDIGYQSEVNIMVNEKYYEGYEGDEEILFRLYVNKEEVESVGIWGGYFSTIIKLIPPQDGGWVGFPYYYHLNSGWYDEENWYVPDIDLFYEQLQLIDENALAYNVDKEVLDLIRSMFSKAKDFHCDITISCY